MPTQLKQIKPIKLSCLLFNISTTMKKVRGSLPFPVLPFSFPVLPFHAIPFPPQNLEHMWLHHRSPTNPLRAATTSFDSAYKLRDGEFRTMFLAYRSPSSTTSMSCCHHCPCCSPLPPPPSPTYGPSSSIHIMDSMASYTQRSSSSP
jgi:hypothetical protein